MVRIGGKTSNQTKPAPAPAAAPAKPATTPAVAPAPAAKPAAPAAAPAAPQQPQVTNIYVSHAPAPTHHAAAAPASSGPGFMGMMAASVGGAVIGNGISHMLFDKSAPAAPAQSSQLQQQYAGTSCQPMITNYAKCLEANNNNADSCKWAWEAFTECDAKLPKA